MLQDADAQSARSRSGRAFEDVVAKILNALLTSEGIYVVRGATDALRECVQDAQAVQAIVDYSRLPVKRPCDQKQLEDYPDSDLYALAYTPEGWRILALINCKVSLHSRHTMTCFGGLAVRMSTHLKFVFVTEDRDIYKPKASELGASCQASTAGRRLLESFTDGVYITKYYTGLHANQLEGDIVAMASRIEETGGVVHLTATDSPVFDDPSIPNHTRYCVAVRPFDDLIPTLARWRRERFPQIAKPP